MSKLPADFVKAPAPAQQQKPRTRHVRKASLISPEPVTDPRVLSLQLTEEEYAALEQARQKLHDAGSQVTLEQMIHRVLADWMLRARAIVQPAPAATEPPRPAAATAPRDERMLARLRTFVAAPLRTWLQLAAEMWRKGVASAGTGR